MLYFKKDKNATEMQNKKCVIFGECTVNDQICRKWFVKFDARDFLLNNTS